MVSFNGRYEDEGRKEDARFERKNLGEDIAEADPLMVLDGEGLDGKFVCLLTLTLTLTKEWFVCFVGDSGGGVGD